MPPALLFAVSVAGILIGLIAAAVGVAGTTRPAAPTSKTRQRLRRWWAGEGLSVRERRFRQFVAAATAAVTAAVWLLTAIPVAGIIAGLAVAGVPWLFTSGRAEQRAIDKLQALEMWTRRLTDIVRTGQGLTQAIILSARDAPPAIADDLHDLGTQLRAGVPIKVALDRFAAALADAASDQVIVTLRLHAEDQGQRLAHILDLASANIGREIAMRRAVWADRADPRLTTRFMTGVTVTVVTLLFSNPTYIRPYATLLGQLVLTACTAVFVALLLWIRHLSQARQVPRLLATGDGA